MIWLLVAIYILILGSELPALIKNRWYREITIFTLIFLVSVYMGMVQFYHWPFYNPLDALLPIFAGQS